MNELVKEYGYAAHIKSRGEENIRIEMQVLGKKMGCRKDTFLAKQIQKTAYKKGNEN